MRKRLAGFTLIELVATTAVLAILSGIALPSMSQLLEHSRTSAAVESLTTHMQLARMAAISRNRRAVLCPSSDGHNCDIGTDWSMGWMVFVDDDGNRRPDAHDDVLRVEQVPTSQHLRVFSTVGRRQLRYLPNGTSSGSNLTLKICNDHGELLAKVIVNNVGRPRSERYSVPTPCPT